MKMETKKLEFRGGSFMSLIPFVVFIVVTIVLSFANFQDINMMVAAGLFDFSALISIGEGSIGGAIPNGVAGMFNVSILLMVVVSMGNLMIASGCMERVVNWLNESVIKSERGAELSLFCRATMLSYLICT